MAEIVKRLPCIFRKLLPECLQKHLPCVTVTAKARIKISSDLHIAAFPFIDAHYKYALPYEQFEFTTGLILKDDKPIGKFKITVEQISSGE